MSSGTTAYNRSQRRRYLDRLFFVHDCCRVFAWALWLCWARQLGNVHGERILWSFASLAFHGVQSRSSPECLHVCLWCLVFVPLSWHASFCRQCHLEWHHPSCDHLWLRHELGVEAPMASRSCRTALSHLHDLDSIASCTSGSATEARRLKKWKTDDESPA